METDPSRKTDATEGCAAMAGSGFRPGDVAYRKTWNRPRLLIVRIEEERIHCINEFDQDYGECLATLETRDEWVASCRRIAGDCDLTGSQVRQYIEDGTKDFEPGPRWKAALLDIQND